MELAVLGSILPHLQERTFLDIGAEQGAFSSFLMQAGLTGHLFEPYEGHAEKLRTLVAGTGSVFHPLAIDDHDHAGSLRLASDPAGQPLDYFHSLQPLADDRRIRQTRTQPVQCRSLGSLVTEGILPARIGLIKTDTEGNDAAVLRGMPPLRCEALLCEFFTEGLYAGWQESHPANIITLARALGFENYAAFKHTEGFDLFSIGPAAFLPKTWGNLLFLAPPIWSACLPVLLSAARQSETRLLQAHEALQRETVTLRAACEERLGLLTHLNAEKKAAVAEFSSSTEVLRHQLLGKDEENTRLRSAHNSLLVQAQNLTEQCKEKEQEIAIQAAAKEQFAAANKLLTQQSLQKQEEIEKLALSLQQRLEIIGRHSREIAGLRAQFEQSAAATAVIRNELDRYRREWQSADEQLRAKEAVIQSLKLSNEERLGMIEELKVLLHDNKTASRPLRWRKKAGEYLKKIAPRLALADQLSLAQIEYRHCIESPTVSQVTGAVVIIRGWCFRADGAVIRGLRATVGGKGYAGEYGYERPDVATHYGNCPGSLRSGFSAKILLRRPSSTVILEVQNEAGGWGPLKKLALTHAASPRLVEIWRRICFWTLFPFNHGRAWAMLTPGDRERLLFDLEKKGWLTLGRLQQHAPKPLQAEKFPRPRLAANRLPKFTIVTPSYNQGAFLGKTIASVLGNAELRIDYIVQDGGSGDNSVEVIKHHEPRLKFWCSEKDHGQSDAIARGFTHLDCGPDDILAYLNSDDVFMPGALRFVAEIFARKPGVDVIYGHRVLIDEHDREIGRWITPRHDSEVLAYTDLIPQETLFWRRRIYDKIGGINPSFKFAMDWDLLARFQQAGARMIRVPYFLGLFRVHAAQKTSSAINDVGRAEMDRIRDSIHGRRVSPQEILARHDQSRVESALLSRLMRFGIRI